MPSPSIYHPVWFFFFTIVLTFALGAIAAFFGRQYQAPLFLLGLCVPCIVALVMIYSSHNEMLIADFWKRLWLFKISPTGAFTKILNLDPTGSFPGWYPLGGMIQASDGNLYGTTENGGPPDCNCGTAYQLTLVGGLSLLVGFEDVTDGRLPVSVPLQGGDGILYITNSRGPSIGPHDGGGTVIQISNGLPKPKPGISKFLPASGPIGQHVTISGIHFVGTTKVSFNGTGATFTVKSTNTITATVPAGATSGPITVTNAGGSFRSTANFTVLP